MTDIYKLFEDEIWKPDDLTNCIWYESAEGAVFWNTENNIEDLENRDGATYAGVVMYGSLSKGFYVLYALLEDGCASVNQAIFDLRNKKEF